MRGKRADGAEITTVEGEHGAGAVFGGESDIHTVGQVNIEAGVRALYLASSLEQFDRDCRNLKPPTLCLEDDEVDKG